MSPLILPSRRAFLGGLGASLFIAQAPALVRIEALMPVKKLETYRYELLRRLPLPLHPLPNGEWTGPPKTLERYIVETLLPLTKEQLDRWQFADRPPGPASGWSIVVMPDQLTPRIARGDARAA